MHMGVRIERMLEAGAHQDAFVSADDVYRAVALMHIEINDRNPFQVVEGEGAHGRQCHVVIEAEPHGFGAFGMVPGWAGADKRVGHLTAHHHIDRLDIAAGGQSGGAQGIRHHGGVRIGKHPAPGRLHHI